MSNNNQYFHFTLGPVQGFVSQARRTRDFWAGSFILSWLVGVAIQAVEYQDGEVSFPKADGDYMKWLVGEGEKNKPTQGSIPNRFKAEVNGDFNPNKVTAAVNEAWAALAELVWKQDLSHIDKDGETANIWSTQIANFWDMSWVITDEETDSSALDKRKNWRSYTPPPQQGVKCAMMDGWQELSGVKSPNKESMNSFWQPIVDNGKKGMKSDLNEGEALCAMAFIKRRFSRHFANLDHTMSQGWRLKGWSVSSAVPSVTYMAAIHWIEGALNHANEEELHDFYEEAKQLTGVEYGEWNTRIKCLENLPAWKQRDWTSLDGNVFFGSLLDNPNNFAETEQARRVKHALNEVSNSANIEPASPFYAILLMDGDSLGKHMSNIDEQEAITQGLADFTNGVPAIVRDSNGFLIYAGGDDVLAILPLEDAIPCAAELREHYLECFKYKAANGDKKERVDINTTLSGAIEFTHIKTPLTKVLKDSHSLLDDVAKDDTGRDALAIRVWKPGGLQLQWSQPWATALTDEKRKGEDKKSRFTHIEDLVNIFQQSGGDRPTTTNNVDAEQEQFASKFFYKIREHFTLLNPDTNKATDAEDDAPILTEDQAIALMAMEYLNSGKSDISVIKNAQQRMDEAKQRIQPLMEQCRPHKRTEETGKIEPVKHLEADGALLVRFLANKGLDRESRNG